MGTAEAPSARLPCRSLADVQSPGTQGGHARGGGEKDGDAMNASRPSHRRR
jgi:hypothetical protein